MTWAGGTPQVTLADPCADFAFKPLLYEALSGDAPLDAVVAEYAELLSETSVRFVHARVEKIEHLPTGGGSVLTADSSGALRRLPYDWLVVACGADPGGKNVPGAAEYGVSFASAADLATAADAIDRTSAVSLSEGYHVVVVGGGPAGVELALAAKVRLRRSGHSDARVCLLCASDNLLGPSAAAGARTEACQALHSEGVALRYNARVVQLSSAPDSGQASTLQGPGVNVALAEGEAVRAQLVLWAAGSRPKQLLPDFSGVGPSLRCPESERIFVIGDAAAAASEGYVSHSWRAPATAQAAMQQADYAAEALHALIGLPHSGPGADWHLPPFRYRHLGTMLTLGPGRAAVTIAGPGECGAPPHGARGATLTLRGPAAAALRRLVYVARMPTFETRRRAAVAWCSAGPSVWLPPEGPRPLDAGSISPFAEDPTPAAVAALGAAQAAARGFARGLRRARDSAAELAASQARAAAAAATSGATGDSTHSQEMHPTGGDSQGTGPLKSGRSAPAAGASARSARAQPAAGIQQLWGSFSAPAMRSVTRKATVRSRRRRAWCVVADALGYPSFVPWCAGAVAEDAEPDIAAVDAAAEPFSYHCRIRFGFGSVLSAEEMLLRVSLQPRESVEALLVEPTPNVHHLRFFWTFADLPDGPRIPGRSSSPRCELSVRVDVQCATAAHDSLFAWYESKVVQDMVEAFSQRIEAGFEDPDEDAQGAAARPDGAAPSVSL